MTTWSYTLAVLYSQFETLLLKESSFLLHSVTQNDMAQGIPLRCLQIQGALSRPDKMLLPFYGTISYHCYIETICSNVLYLLHLAWAVWLKVSIRIGTSFNLISSEDCFYLIITSVVWFTFVLPSFNRYPYKNTTISSLMGLVHSEWLHGQGLLMYYVCNGR